MSKVRLLTLAVVALLLLNLGVLAFLFLHRPGHVPPQEGPKRIIIERLHLSEAQIEQYEQLITQHQKDIRQLDREIRHSREQLYASLAVDKPDGRDSLISRMGKLQQQIERTHYAHFESIRNLCTPAQQKDFEALTHELAEYFSPGKKMPPHRRVRP